MFHRIVNLSKSNSFFLFGARGTGKSTLLREQFGPFSSLSTIYIDLLRFSERSTFEADPDILEARILPETKLVVLDEIQRVPALLDTVHRLIESLSAVKFAMTGSSARKLKAGGANMLAGRAFAYELFPLTHLELGSQFNLLEALRWGTLPKLYQFSTDEDKKLFLEAYAQTYLKEEVWDEHLVKKLNPFRRFLEVAAQSNGTVINYSKISKDVQVDTKTVQSYFQILEDTLLSYMLEPYHSSPRKRLRQNPKFYLFDIGVTRALTQDFAMGINYGSLGFGYRFEHFIITEAYRLNSSLKRGLRFSYIRNKDDREIDLVIERPGQPLTLVEIKSTTSLDESHLSSLTYFQKHFPTANYYCLSLDPNPKVFGKIRALPWQLGFKELDLGI
jgi:uncharacterized protein